MDVKLTFVTPPDESQLAGIRSYIAEKYGCEEVGCTDQAEHINYLYDLELCL